MSGAVGDHYVVGGQAYPRVTSILNTIANPGLDKWRRRVGFEEADRISNEAAEFGTRLHALVEGICKGEIGGFEPDVAATCDAFDGWFQRNVAETVATEKLVVHHGLKYAGTCDAILRLKDDRLVVADWKSSNSVSDRWPLQLVAYQAALMYWGDHDVTGRIVVQMPSRQPGALEVHEYHQDKADWADFKAALQLYRRFGSGK